MPLSSSSSLWTTATPDGRTPPCTCKCCPPCPGSDDGIDDSSDFEPTESHTPVSEFSILPIRYQNGEIQLAITDMSTDGYGAFWGHTRIYNNRLSENFDFGNGWNWMVSQWGYLVEGDGGAIGVVRSPRTTIWFNLVDSDYQMREGSGYLLSHDAESNLFTLFIPNGQTWQFHDFSQHEYPLGVFAGFTSAGGTSMNVVSYIGDNIGELQRSDSTTTESFLYTYDMMTGSVTTVMLRRRIGAGAWTEVRRVSYEYYSTGSSDGSPGDLQKATLQQLSGVTWEDVYTSYYRYYVNGDGGKGFQHGLKYVVGSEAYRRLAIDHDPITADDDIIAEYADYYFEYDSEQRVTKEITFGGSQEYSFCYTPGTATDGYNHWNMRTVETRPDGATVTVFTNYLGQILLRSLSLAGKTWTDFQQFDDNGQLSVQYTPASVASYSYGDDSLAVEYNDSGLIKLSEHYTSTGSGEVTGYLSAEKIKDGPDGDEITLQEYTYDTTLGSTALFPVSIHTVYRDEAGLEPIETNYSYTLNAAKTLVKTRIITWAAVLTGQNGSGSSDVRNEIYDDNGKLIAVQNEDKYINTFVYDAVKGVMLKEVVDDNAPDGSGWTPPAVARLQLTSDFEYDDLARLTQALGPAHNYDGTNVRSASWIVYKDIQKQRYEGRGYAVGTMGSYSYYLVNPVYVTNIDDIARVVDAIQAVRSTSASGRLTESDTFDDQSDWRRWSHFHYNNTGMLICQRDYFDIPSSGGGSPGTNYDDVTFGYDSLDRRNRIVTPAGTITRSVFEARGFLTKTFSGTNDYGATNDDPTGGGAFPNDMKLTIENVYDNGSGGGNGDLTSESMPVDDSTSRVTAYLYDFRSRQTTIDGEVDFYEVKTYDNLNNIVRIDRLNTDSDGNLIARSERAYDNRGRTYQMTAYAVNTDTGVPGNSLVTSFWYDGVGNIIKSASAGSQLFLKAAYDGAGRAVEQYLGFYTGTDPEPYSDVVHITSDNIINEQIFNTYDEASNLIYVARYERCHDSTGGGILNGLTGSQPKALIGYAACWFDALDRVEATANYGTHVAGEPSRPTSPPTSSDTVLVNLLTYDDAGEIYEAIDPAGSVVQVLYDNVGRIKELQQDTSDVAITTQWTYLAGSRQWKTVKVLNSGTGASGDQTTTNVFGTTLGGSAIASKDLLSGTIYPDATDGTDQVNMLYNRQAQPINRTDQNGTVHEYDYDLLGRLTGDRVTVLGTSGSAVVDGSVRRINRGYEVRGMLQNVTSHSATSGGHVVNDLLFVYNDFCQLVTEYQECTGPVVIGTSPKVQYAYADGSANTIRRTQTTYPSGRNVGYGYGDSDSANDRLSRVATITSGGDSIVNYTYLGLTKVVQTEYPEPQIKWDLIQDSNVYPGLDQFWRTADCLWEKESESTTSINRDSTSSSAAFSDALVQIKYGYNRANSRLWHDDLVAKNYGQAFDELYTYDGMQRLKVMKRGILNSHHTGIMDKTLEQDWVLDQTGNWLSFEQDESGTSNDINQSRSTNKANEITTITNTVGASWASPAYNRAGNMTSMPRPLSLSSSYTAIYDAWNRLVQVSTASATVAKYAYDGTNRLVTRLSGGVDLREFYYSERWQVLAEYIEVEPSDSESDSGEPSLDREYVWGLRFVDDLALRDRDTDGNSILDERLYVMQDDLWSVVAVSTESGTVVERYTYTGYGVADVLEGDFGNRTATLYDWNHCFTGRWIDPSTKLQLNRNRWLHQYLGKWITRDPIGYVAGNRNLYRYVNNSPTNAVDPSGNVPTKPGGDDPPPKKGLFPLFPKRPESNNNNPPPKPLFPLFPNPKDPSSPKPKFPLWPFKNQGDPQTPRPQPIRDGLKKIMDELRQLDQKIKDFLKQKNEIRAEISDDNTKLKFLEGLITFDCTLDDDAIASIKMEIEIIKFEIEKLGEITASLNADIKAAQDEAGRLRTEGGIGVGVGIPLGPPQGNYGGVEP